MTGRVLVAAVVLGALVAYVWFIGGPVPWHLAEFGAGLAVVVLWPRWAPLDRITVRRTVPARPVTAGDTVAVMLEVGLPRWPWLYLRIREETPVSLATPLEPALVFVPWRAATLTVRYTVERIPRGVHHWEAIQLETGDLSGWFVRRRRVAAPDSLEVWPAPRPWPTGLVLDPGGDEQAGPGFGGNTTVLRSVRPLAPGDRATRMHWPSTARTGQFMAKQFEPPSFKSIVVALDHPGRFGQARLEDAVGIAATVIRRALADGWAVGLYVHGAVSLPPRGGPTAFRSLMHQLALVGRSDRVSQDATPPPGDRLLVITERREPPAWAPARATIVRVHAGGVTVRAPASDRPGRNTR
jgi:uncharacterized protein (DUF58 family)